MVHLRNVQSRSSVIDVADDREILCILSGGFLLYCYFSLLWLML